MTTYSIILILHGVDSFDMAEAAAKSVVEDLNEDHFSCRKWSHFVAVDPPACFTEDDR